MFIIVILALIANFTLAAMFALSAFAAKKGRTLSIALLSVSTVNVILLFYLGLSYFGLRLIA